MARPYVINITDGSGSGQILNGAYDVTADVTGYENLSIQPDTVNVVGGTDSYAFTIASSGTLTLHVTEEGNVGGTPIEGATFYRCDSTGQTYGDPIVTDEFGDAVFEYVPFADTGAPTIYFMQTTSDGDHEFDPDLADTTMDTDTQTLQIANPAAALRTIALTDANYLNLPIETGSITLS